MSKVAIFTAVKTILEGVTFLLPPYPSTTMGSFQLVTIGERKDYQNQTPIAAILAGPVIVKQQAMPQKWNHYADFTLLIYVAYVDQGTAELTRASIADAVLNTFERRRKLGGARDVNDSFPTEWTPGYQEVGGTIYLMAQMTLRVWEQTDAPITP